MAKAKKRKLSREEREEQRLAIEYEWTQLEAALEHEMETLGPSRLEVGGILYKMKLWLNKWGMSKGRKGRWTPLLRKHKIAPSTAYEWVCLYQEEAEIPRDQWVFIPEKSHKYSKKNPPETNGLTPVSCAVQACKAEIETETTEDMRDNSEPPRMAVECIFCLTVEERRRFMEAVARLGSVEATQRMYRALVSL